MTFTQLIYSICMMLNTGELFAKMAAHATQNPLALMLFDKKQFVLQTILEGKEGMPQDQVATLGFQLAEKRSYYAAKFFVFVEWLEHLSDSDSENKSFHFHRFHEFFETQMMIDELFGRKWSEHFYEWFYSRREQNTTLRDVVAMASVMGRSPEMVLRIVATYPEHSKFIVSEISYTGAHSDDGVIEEFAKIAKEVMK